MTTRAEREAEAQRLRGEGLLLREIAEQMGVAVSTVGAWLNDPGGTRMRQRKLSYRGTCKDCGVPTDGSRGPGRAPDRCVRCLGLSRVQWTEEAVVAAIRRFVDRYDRVPAAADFNPGQARSFGHHWRAERFYKDGDYPLLLRVQKRFGSWSAGISAAGFEPWGSGRYDRRGGRGTHLDKERPAA